MPDLAVLVAHGGDGNALEVGGAVFLPILEFTIPGLAGENGLPEFLIEGLRGLAGLENTGILAADLGEGVASEVFELGVDVLDVSVKIRDDDAGRALLDGPGEVAKAGFGSGTFSDVTPGAEEDVAVTARTPLGEAERTVGVTELNGTSYRVGRNPSWRRRWIRRDRGLPRE
jgi:hypothetical protein